MKIDVADDRLNVLDSKASFISLIAFQNKSCKTGRCLSFSAKFFDDFLLIRFLQLLSYVSKVFEIDE